MYLIPTKSEHFCTKVLVLFTVLNPSFTKISPTHFKCFASNCKDTEDISSSNELH